MAINKENRGSQRELVKYQRETIPPRSTVNKRWCGKEDPGL